MGPTPQSEAMITTRKRDDIIILTVLSLSCLLSLAGTPYEGGLFKMKLVLPKEFPATPPLGIYIKLYTIYTLP